MFYLLLSNGDDKIIKTIILQRKFEACNYDTLKDTIKHNGKHGINEEDLFPLYDQAKNDINVIFYFFNSGDYYYYYYDYN